MTDKELLELAAKAAGLKLDEVHLAYLEDEQTFIRHEPDSDGISGEWDPLTDDGDALRLAVKLEMEINCMELSQFQVTTYDDKGNATYTDDSCVRRAIVRSAAEIGKGM